MRKTMLRTVTVFILFLSLNAMGNTVQSTDGSGWHLKKDKGIIPPSDTMNAFSAHSDDSLVLLPKIPCPVVVLNGVKCKGREAARKMDRNQSRMKQRTLIKK